VQDDPRTGRTVNNLALQSLVTAFTDDRTIIESSARAAITEVTAK
jgi:hypothetical protein